MQTLKNLPRIAAIIAFVIAGFFVLAGLFGPIVILPSAIVPLYAGVGILRKRAWSVYGSATFLLAQLILLPSNLFRPGYSIGHTVQIIFRL